MSDSSSREEVVVKQTIQLSAKACLWFAWAPTDFNGPEGEVGSQTENSYRPTPITVNGASQVVISAAATTSAGWRHHPTDDRASGPAGLNDMRGLENAAYRNSAYNSQNINPLTANLNELVAIFEINNAAPTVATNQHRIGAGITLSVPNGATKLFFGFHDGRHWTNNEGSVTVTANASFKNSDKKTD